MADKHHHEHEHHEMHMHHHKKHGGATMKGAKGHHHGRKEGGRTDMWVAGNPDVKKEAYGEESYDKGDERKRGGKMMKKHKRADGGKVLGLMTGGVAKPRQDRPQRARGGGVGSDRSPLSSAHKTSGSNPTPHSTGGN